MQRRAKRTRRHLVESESAYCAGATCTHCRSSLLTGIFEFGTRGSEVQILSPRPIFSSTWIALLVFHLQRCSRFCRRSDPQSSNNQENSIAGWRPISRFPLLPAKTQLAPDSQCGEGVPDWRRSSVRIIQGLEWSHAERFGSECGVCPDAGLCPAFGARHSRAVVREFETEGWKQKIIAAVEDANV